MSSSAVMFGPVTVTHRHAVDHDKVFLILGESGMMDACQLWRSDDGSLDGGRTCAISSHTILTIYSGLRCQSCLDDALF